MDIEALREDLIDYFGTAMMSGFPMAIMDLSEVEDASDLKLIMLAEKVGFDLNKYKSRDDEER